MSFARTGSIPVSGTYSNPAYVFYMQGFFVKKVEKAFLSNKKKAVSGYGFFAENIRNILKQH